MPRKPQPAPLDGALVMDKPRGRTSHDVVEAVRRIAGRAIAEASGRITPATAPAIAGAGVDLISAGWLTHSAQVLDIGLDWRRASAGAERSAA